MILITELTEPYTEEEKFNFLVTHKDKIIRFEDDSIKVYKLTEEEKQAEMLEQFNKEFFNTSLGYVRRKVTMKDGTFKDFLTDIVPLLQVGVQIITYTLNGAELTQNTGVTVTEQFINECKQQVFNDFYGISEE